MKVSGLFTKTLRDAPGDEEARNAQLLLRAGYIHKEMAGVYSYEPLGLRVLEKIKQVVREEMNRVGGQEVMMTALQPRELWEKTNRWDDKIVDNWFKTKLANGTELGVGLTHEEPITAMAGKYVKSYKDLPFSVYQIQTKFRNELRAKSGLLRGREFIMKDMYSFARDRQEHMKIYEEVAGAYYKVYERLGLGDLVFRTKADGGIFTEEFSDEFQALSEVGEDMIYLDRKKKLAVNKEVMTDKNLEEFGLKRDELEEVKAIEVGNIFHLETKYPDALDVHYTDEDDKQKSIIMGCYGIGVSRLMGAVAEIFADDKGLVWPEQIAPFEYYLIGIGEEGSKKAAEIYTGHEEKFLWDDRDARPGEKFADSELMGMPYRVVISDKTLIEGKAELVTRNSGEIIMLTLDELVARISYQ
jgi:prolyl-tRNA synthetase